jgi:hypothetical protein
MTNAAQVKKMANRLRNSWQWIVLGFLGVILSGSLLGWLSVISGGVIWSMPDYVVIAFIFGGCPGVAMFLIIPLYLVVRTDLHRQRSANEKTIFDFKSLARNFLLIYIVLVLIFFIFQRLVLSRLWWG